jgi:predicted lactoylglutathione lyase
MYKHINFLILMSFLGFSAFLIGMEESSTEELSEAGLTITQLPGELQRIIFKFALENIIMGSKDIFDANTKLAQLHYFKPIEQVNEDQRVSFEDHRNILLLLLNEKFHNTYINNDLEENNEVLKRIFNITETAQKTENEIDAAQAISAGADVNLTLDTWPKNPILMQAIYLGYKKLAKLLIERGADVNARNARCNTPLMEAIINESPEIFKLLLEHNADPDAKNNTKETALIWAVFQNRLDFVQELLKYNVDTEAKDFDGNTALKIAKRRGNKEVVKLLKSPTKCIVS